MKIVFMGTPETAVLVLSALLDGGHEVVGVYAQPDRPRGRGERVSPPPAKRFAEDRGLTVFQPVSLRPAEEQQRLAALDPDAIVVAAYGRILPSGILAVPRLGCLNVHPSLLPRHRGPSPVETSILCGDEVTGATVIRLDEGMDTGPVLAQQRTPVAHDETADALSHRLFAIGAALLVETLPRWARGEVAPVPQDESRATVTRMLTREDGNVDWEAPAERLARQVRAYHPWPGAHTRWRGKTLKLLRVQAAVAVSSPGPGWVTLLEGGLLGVGTGRGVLVVSRLQLEGRRPVDAAEFVRGYAGFVGATVGE